MNERTPVVVTDVRIPFFRLVLFFIKAGLAAIPAIIIVSFVVTVILALLAIAFGGSPMIVFRQWAL
jgi:hypothetical protein